MGVWWYVCLSRGALVGHTVTWNQGLRDDLRAPDDPACSGLKEVLLAYVGVQAEGIILLSGMLWTGPRVDADDERPSQRSISLCDGENTGMSRCDHIVSIFGGRHATLFVGVDRREHSVV